MNIKEMHALIGLRSIEHSSIGNFDTLLKTTVSARQLHDSFELLNNSQLDVDKFFLSGCAGSKFQCESDARFKVNEGIIEDFDTVTNFGALTGEKLTVFSHRYLNLGAAKTVAHHLVIQAEVLINSNDPEDYALKPYQFEQEKEQRSSRLIPIIATAADPEGSPAQNASITLRVNHLFGKYAAIACYSGDINISPLAEHPENLEISPRCVLLSSIIEASGRCHLTTMKLKLKNMHFTLHPSPELSAHAIENLPASHRGTIDLSGNETRYFVKKKWYPASEWTLEQDRHLLGLIKGDWYLCPKDPDSCRSYDFLKEVTRWQYLRPEVRLSDPSVIVGNAHTDIHCQQGSCFMSHIGPFDTSFYGKSNSLVSLHAPEGFDFQCIEVVSFRVGELHTYKHEKQTYHVLRHPMVSVGTEHTYRSGNVSFTFSRRPAPVREEITKWTQYISQNSVFRTGEKRLLSGYNLLSQAQEYQLKTGWLMLGLSRSRGLHTVLLSNNT